METTNKQGPTASYKKVINADFMRGPQFKDYHEK
jgi:hypothetical protein